MLQNTNLNESGKSFVSALNRCPLTASPVLL